MYNVYKNKIENLEKENIDLKQQLQESQIWANERRNSYADKEKLISILKEKVSKQEDLIE